MPEIRDILSLTFTTEREIISLTQSEIVNNNIAYHILGCEKFL